MNKQYFLELADEYWNSGDWERCNRIAGILLECAERETGEKRKQYLTAARAWSARAQKRG